MMEVFRLLEHRLVWEHMLGVVEHMGQAYGPCQCGYSQNNVLHGPHIHHATSTEIVKRCKYETFLDFLIFLTHLGLKCMIFL